MTRENPLPPKKEMAGHARSLSPSLGVISLIPPPTPGLKGLRSGAMGEYNSPNIFGGMQINGGGLRDGGPIIAPFPSATIIPHHDDCRVLLLPVPAIHRCGVGAQYGTVG